jgi:hypothetical protein
MHPRDFDAALDEASIERLRKTHRLRRHHHVRDAPSAQGRQRISGRDPHRRVPA